MEHNNATVVDVLPIDVRGDGWKVLVLRRAEGTRCTGAWEAVHGRIEPGERPEGAAVRELREETGLVAERLYNVTCQSFYLHAVSAVQLAVVFAAFVDSAQVLTLGPEHDGAEWLGLPQASERLVWPRTRRALADAFAVLKGGSAGPVEDVLRVF
jgi:8-oxo-dGTP pyrophosphatase MutT (NUDIX family)